MLTVVQTLTSLHRGSGGTAQVVPRLSDALVDLGCNVSVVYVQDTTPCNTVSPTKAIPTPARAVHFLGRALWSSNFHERIRSQLPPAGPRLIHDHGVWSYTNFLAAGFAMRHRIPLVISPHGMLEPWALRYKAGKKKIARALYQQRILNSAALFIVAAESECEALRREGFKQPVAVVPHGVSMPTTTALHASVSDQRKIVFLSRIHPKKGLIPFVEAWCSARRPGWKVVIAGPDEGGHRAEVEALISHRGLGAEFEFPGQVDGEAKRLLFESADIFVLPTFSENFGVVVAEALSYSVPVLTTHAAPWSILKSIDAGWWVEPGIAGTLAGLNTALATTSEQRAAMGRAGRAYVAEHLGWETAARKVHDAYAWSLGLRADKPDHVHID